MVRTHNAYSPLKASINALSNLISKFQIIIKWKDTHIHSLCEAVSFYFAFYNIMTLTRLHSPGMPAQEN
jgi:vacuolar-type H+-ATPase subunit C/Vma6